MKKIVSVKRLIKQNRLQGIDLEVEPGEMVAVMGPSGSGKSTLLYQISGMDQPDAGQVFLEDKDIVPLSEDEKAKLRLEKMGFVFQQMNVLSDLNIVENIMLPAAYGMKKINQKKLHKKAIAEMEKFGIAELADRRVTEVSGGQLQRACICRSLLMEPKILFADEPTGALNQKASLEVMDTFCKVNSMGTTILMVTHDSKVASRCDRILYLIDGEIRDEIWLGKYEEEEKIQREQIVSGWLQSFGW